MAYACTLAAAAAAILLLGMLGILIFDPWMQVGLGASIVVCGGPLLFAWMTDRTDGEARAEIGELRLV